MRAMTVVGGGKTESHLLLIKIPSELNLTHIITIIVVV